MGFMGVGKGSLARELAKQTGRIAIDSDDLIESMQNTKISKLFEKEGEEYFRKCEKDLSKWMKKSVQNSIISIGGGFHHVGNLQKIAHVIYLESSFDSIVDRIKSFDNAKRKFKKRPLLQNMTKAKALIAQRHPSYVEQSNLRIQTAGKTSVEIAQEIIETLKLEQVQEN